MMGPHCRKHQPSDLNFAILPSVQPRETGEKKHQLARTKPKRKDESRGEISDAFMYCLPHTKYQGNHSLFLIHVQPKGWLCRSGRVGSLASPTCWIPRAAWPMDQLSQRAAQTPASHRPVSEPGARWSGSLETRGSTLPGQSAYVQPFPGLIQSCESSRLCSPDGAWPVPPLKGTAVTDQIVPYCQQLSGYLGSVICFGITSVPILLKEGSAAFLFFFLLIYLGFWLSLLVQDKFSLLQKPPLSPNTSVTVSWKKPVPDSTVDFTSD